jgi:hypothetical protein
MIIGICQQKKRIQKSLMTSKKAKKSLMGLMRLNFQGAKKRKAPDKLRLRLMRLMKLN